MDTSKLWFLLPFGLILLMVFHKDTEKPSEPNTGKEAYYLKFNKDEIFKGVLATEGHFRNVKETGIDREGFLNCAVKHLADVEGHLDEAISHSLIAESEEQSKQYRELRNDVRWFRHELQAGNVTPEEGIKQVRKIRRAFESFNPEFDISKCESCTVKVEITGLGD